ncbi:MAG: carbon starvation protein A [Candidatus Omnitrophica bacterium]|nr:carbon starvation protein A [Candidatus Omnitrophota bacterium]
MFCSVILILVAGYYGYGRYIAGIVGIDKKAKTPSSTHYDGIDYVPAKNPLMLFGHHFASIAGAGPIVGPVLAYLNWGWLPALIWIILGSLFIGGVHDFLALVISVREGGKTLGAITEKYVSRRASKMFLIFLWFALLLVVAVFASLCAKSFISQPQVVIPSLGMIPVALIIGVAIYRLRMKTLWATILGLIILTILIVLGNVFPFSLNTADPYRIWMIVLFIYAFIASVLPVHILLQPRDYLSSFLLFFGIAVATIGLLIKPYSVSGAKLFVAHAPLGPLFPVMFITIACGAISGFHSLVSSGTTSKQITSETHIKPIGYGAMIVEGLLATIVLFCVAFGVKNVSPGLSTINAFSIGFSQITYFLGGYGQVIALIILNAFILTTLDTATRITRFLTQELFGFDNKWVATAIVVFCAGYLGFSGGWERLWPIFGASNQLVAALALIVAASWLLSFKKNHTIALIPAIAMLGITIFALGAQAITFLRTADYLLFGITLVLLLMSGMIVSECRMKPRADSRRM